MFVLALTGACTATDPSAPATTPASVEQSSPSPRAVSRDCEDGKLIASLHQYSSAWNEAAEPFVAQYLDPNVTAEEWLVGGARNIAVMEHAAAGLRHDVSLAHDRRLRTLLLRVSDNYQLKLIASQAVVTAVKNGDVNAEAAAAEQLTQAASAGREIGNDLIDFIEASPQFTAACT